MLTQRQSYVLVAAVIALSLIASGTPSPLYETYRELCMAGLSERKVEKTLRQKMSPRPKSASDSSWPVRGH